MLQLSLAVHCRDDSLTGEGWPASRYRLSYYRELTLAAERGLLTAIMLEGAVAPETHPGGLDPVLLAASLAPVASRIGLVAAISTDHYEPYHIARATASLDHLSKGRCGWLLVPRTEADEEAGKEGLVVKARRQELVEVTRKLWDSWKDGAIRIDREAGVFADPRYVQPIHHQGIYYQVRGPLNVVRPVQGHPVLAQEVRHEADLAFAAGHADWIIAEAGGPEQAAVQSAAIRQAAESFGRDPAQLRLSHRASLVFEDSPQPATEPTGFAFHGNAECMADEMSRWLEMGATEGFHLDLTEPLSEIGRVADELVPALQRRGLYRAAYSDGTLRDWIGLNRPAALWTGEEERK